MSTFDTYTSSPFKPLDASKRVNFRFGLVLGADEFWQQDAYTREADWLATRALHGYGTVAGLRIEVTTPAEGPMVNVSAGAAVNPRGQVIVVPTAQCALLNAWLARTENRRTVAQAHSSPPVSASPPPPLGVQIGLNVVLRYDECETDPVPIPGGPCRTQEDSVAASRVTDRFTLTFELQPPQQNEEQVVRELGRMFDSFLITNIAPFATDADIRTRVLALNPITPDSGVQMRLNLTNAKAQIRLAYQTFITEIRPRYMSFDKNPASGPSDESGVLIARLTFLLDANWRVSGAVTIDQLRRPLLMSTRQMQEWLMAIHG